MEIEKLAHKLEPLMPTEVADWLKVRDVADTETRSLIEKQIVITAYKVLGDFRKKALLSLPPERLCKGTFHLGTVQYERSKWPFGLSTGELLQGLAILGRSGSGKTNAAFHLLEQLAARKIPFLFLDWKRTARHLLPHLKANVNVYTPGRPLAPLSFNPFIPPPGLEPNVYINQVVDVLSDAYTLGDGARSILQRALAACYEQGKLAPQVADVLAEVEKLPEKGRAEGWKISTVRALESLRFADLTSTDAGSQEGLAQALLRENTIIELDALGGSEKSFLVPLLCQWLYLVQLSDPVREKLHLVVFVEEAHNVLYRSAQRTNESLMNRLLRQCREIGIAFVVIDQHPHLLSSAALGNTYTSICLNLKDPADINRAAGICLLDEDEKRFLSQLPVGQGIVKLQDRWRRPFVVAVPLVAVNKGAVTDAALERFLRRQRAGAGQDPALSQGFGRVSRGLVSEEGLGSDELSFLEDVLEHPEDGVKKRYHRLAWSVGRGNRVKHELVADGWLEAEIVRVGNSRMVLLRPTKGAKTVLGVDVHELERGSLPHEFWKRFYARKYTEAGYAVELEAARNGGRIDVLAIKDGRSVAIEIETGKSDVVANVRRGLRARIDKILVVATDEKAVAKIEKELAAAGLLIVGRVRLVLREAGLQAP